MEIDDIKSSRSAFMSTSCHKNSSPVPNNKKIVANVAEITLLKSKQINNNNNGS